MIDARDIPDAVLWEEGMLLSPQHFQQADQRSQALLAYMASAAAPYPWGVRTIQVNQAALVGGIFSVDRLEAVMPDGLLVQHPGGDTSSTLQLNLDKASSLQPTLPKGDQGGDQGGDPDIVAVHLVVRAHTPGLSQLGSPGGGLARLRRVEGAQINDDVTGDNPVSFLRLVPALDLDRSGSPLQPPSSRYVSLPLAVLRREGTGFHPMDYEPPRLRVEQGGQLNGVALAIAASLRQKAQDWMGRLQGPASGGNGAHENVGTLRVLVRGIPRLEALLHCGLAHPFDVYLALCDIVGDLGVIGVDLTLPSPTQRYEHADPLAGFNAMARLIERGLGRLRVAYRTVRFVRMGQGRFALASPRTLPTDWLIVGARIGLDHDAGAVLAWFDRAMIGAESRLHEMRQNRVKGARRSAVTDVPEMDLVPPVNTLLFRVKVDPAFISAGQALLVSAPAEDRTGEPAELMLFLPNQGDVEPGSPLDPSA